MSLVYAYYDGWMHEGNEDIEAYKRWLDECFEKDEIFRLEIGEACKIRNEYVDSLPSSNIKNIYATGARFKLFYKRTDEYSYHWLDSEGNQGTDRGPIDFYAKHWEKI